MGLGGFAKKQARKARRAAEKAKRAAENAAKKAAEKAKKAAEETRRAAEKAAKEAEKAAEAAKNATEKAAKEAAERAKKEAEAVKRAAERAAEEAKRAAETAAEETRKAAEAAAAEAVKAAQELEEAAKKAEEALKKAADAALDFATEDVVDAANSVIEWTGDAAGDAGEWVKTASKDTQRAIYKAGQFADRTAEDAGRGMMAAADAVDDVLGDLDERLPDTMMISVGPFDISNEGVSIKPKFEIGLQFGGLDFSMGVEDLRDGFNIGISLDNEIFNWFTEGDDLQELLQSFELKVAGEASFPKEIRGVSIAYLSEPVLPRMILEATGLNLEGFGTIKFTCKVIQGIGARVQLGLGKLFPDTAGYRMYGVGGELALSLKLSFELFVGYKDDGSGFKLNLALPPGVVFEIEWLAADSTGRNVLDSLKGSALEALAKKLKEYMTGTPYLPLGAKLL